MPSDLLVAAQPAFLVSPLCATAVNQIVEAAAGADGEKLPTAFAVAYSGGPMNLGYGRPVYADVAGMEIPSQEIVVLRQHDADRILGQSTRIGAVDGAITADWTVSGDGPHVDQFLKNSRRKIKYQASIGFWAKTWERLDAGQSVSVNGRQVEGPAYIVRSSLLGEYSMVPWGADHKTSNKLAAAAGAPTAEDFMRLNSQFFKAESDGGNGTTKIDATDKTKTDASASTNANGNAVAAGNGDVDAELAEIRKRRATEHRRIATLEEISAKYPGASRKNKDMLAQAIEENWGTDKFELEAMRLDRPSGSRPVQESGTLAGHSPKVLEAAMCRACNLPNLDKVFSKDQIDAAEKSFRRGIGLRELVEIAAAQGGYQGRFKDDPKSCLKAAFSTADFGTLLSAIANKFVDAGYLAVDPVWRVAGKIRSLSDLKQVTRFRLTMDATFEKVNDAGEIKHGSLGDEKYTMDPDTYGKIVGITRKTIINDDRDALSEVPFQVGRGGALKLCEVFWAAFLDNSTFFTTGRGNYKAGATTVLSAEGLRQAVQLFRDQTDPKGKPLGLSPLFILAPTALEEAGGNLYVSAELRDTTASTKFLTGNIYKGKYQPYSTPYLSNSGFTGYSDKAWYLCGDPNALSVIDVGFLDGVDRPIVEQADADFDTLGIEIRGYFDFGVALANYRGAVKMKGEA